MVGRMELSLPPTASTTTKEWLGLWNANRPQRIQMQTKARYSEHKRSIASSWILVWRTAFIEQARIVSEIIMTYRTRKLTLITTWSAHWIDGCKAAPRRTN